MRKIANQYADIVIPAQIIFRNYLTSDMALIGKSYTAIIVQFIYHRYLLILPNYRKS